MRELFHLSFDWFLELDKPWQLGIALALIAIGAGLAVGFGSSKRAVFVGVLGLVSLATWALGA